MLTYKKTRATDRYQDYIIELEYGYLAFAAPLSDNDAKADRLLVYLNGNGVTAWNDMSNAMKCRLSMANVEYKQSR